MIYQWYALLHVGKDVINAVLGVCMGLTVTSSTHDYVIRIGENHFRELKMKQLTVRICTLEM